MDRRTILAFVLIGIIIILTPYYMELVVGDRPRQPDFSELPKSNLELERRRVREPEQKPVVSPERQQEPPPAREEAKQIRDFTPKPVYVETDLFTATFSTAGGTLKSVVLKT
ncbi:MAG TPA: hypothetical protein DIU35_04990, partial [Candidatus Latescibacteria bacterium]|nr:hypothetical protein [Candidatus Latescibacterota bacterium]